MDKYPAHGKLKEIIGEFGLSNDDDDNDDKNSDPMHRICFRDDRRTSLII